VNAAGDWWDAAEFRLYDLEDLPHLIFANGMAPFKSKNRHRRRAENVLADRGETDPGAALIPELAQYPDPFTEEELLRW
jgi:hypothetical protein